MQIEVGLKSDPIEYRYTFEWLFRLMQTHGVRSLQLGSFHELYHVEDGYLHGLRELAARYGVRIRSCFTAHRELGGFFTANRYLEKAARTGYERLIHVGATLGVDYVGANAGYVYRDRPATRDTGVACWLRHMKELMHVGRERGIRGLTVEVMSSTFEPPSTPDEITVLLGELSAYHTAHVTTTVPVYLCGDVSHGLADAAGSVVHTATRMLEACLPWLAELHLKNTDARFGATFGFSPAERERGIVDLASVKRLLDGERSRLPVSDLVAYLEHPGPKLGRDYTDTLLPTMLEESITAVQAVFGGGDDNRLPATRS